MKHILTALLILPVLVFQSCEKRLDIVPPSTAPESLILSNMDGLNGGLNYAYQQLHNDIGRNFTLWSELLSDHLMVDGASVLPTQQFFYERNLDAIVTETVNSTDLRLISDMRLREIYNCINTAALILRACENDLAKNDLEYAANKERVMGECHFLRAVGHFELLRFWALPWGATPGNAHPGIIINELPVDDRESQVKPRASVARVYEFIIQDLQKAESLLPASYVEGVHSAIYNGRAYKDAARGYLVKVYFQQHDYARAKAMIDQVIGSAPGVPAQHQLQTSLSRLFTARGTDNIDPECIYQTTSSTTITTSLSTFWNGNNTESIYSRSPSIPPKGTVTDSFLVGAGFYPQDQRRTLFIQLADGRWSPTKYSLTDHFNIPLIRSAELLLDRAEIYARDNSIDEAMADCNAVRARAQIPLLIAPMTQQALLDSIAVERIRELCFEGDRLHNLKRLQLPVPAGARRGVLPIAWNSKDLVLKYSQEDMARNPLLENNY
jgi:hypothetical protein